MLHRLLIGLASILAATSSASAHETDQFTLPPREFADMGQSFTRWAHRIITNSVEQTNAEIRDALAAKRGPEAIEDLQSPDRLTARVNTQIPWALDVIENLEKRAHAPEARQKYVGRLPAYKNQLYNVYSFSSLPFDPRQLIRFFYSSTIKAHGVHFGTDKVGHFTDMGMNYWRAYRGAVKNGKGEEEATRIAITANLNNPILSEKAFLGMVTAGSYSNADLVANLSGLLFYRNVTEPVMIRGATQPPMVVRDGPYWKLNDHVRRDSDFFELFITEHWDETLNPSVFDGTMREGIRRNVRKHASDLLQRHADVHGARRPREWFEAKAQELSRYYGTPYGYTGRGDDQVTIANTCFEPHGEDAKPDARNRFGETPLHQAAAGGDLAWAKKLIGLGADVNARVQSDERENSEWGNTPLHYAARGGHVAVAEALVAAKADVNAANALGMTPLHRAVKHPKMTDFLIVEGAKVDAQDVRGRTPLHYAATDVQADAAAVLCEHGAQANAKDRDGRTPLHLAALHSNGSAVTALVRKNADVAARDRWGETALHLASATRDAELVKSLLATGADVNAPDEFGYTPLHAAAAKAPPTVVAALVNSGADARKPDAFGNGPIHLACRRGGIEVTQMLLDRGADLSSTGRGGSTPLHEAAASGEQVLVKLLLDRGAPPDARTATGATAAEVAAKQDHAEVSSMLRATRSAVVAQGQ